MKRIFFGGLSVITLLLGLGISNAAINSSPAAAFAVPQNVVYASPHAVISAEDGGDNVAVSFGGNQARLQQAVDDVSSGGVGCGVSLAKKGNTNPNICI